MPYDSRTRVCRECHAPSTLGVRGCVRCGCPEWVWRRPIAKPTHELDEREP